MSTQQHILVVDDDPDIRELLSDYLSGVGYAVATAASAAEMRSCIQNRIPDVVLLDIGLPGEDGLSLARSLREHHDIGIIMVSGAGATVDRIVGLEVGADDYVAKPFDPRELHARIKSVLRRYQRASTEAPAPTAADPRVRVGQCLLNTVSRQLFAPDGDEIPLTAMEFDLLQVFLERPGRPLSRDQILNHTQNRDWDPFDRSIDIRIARLRKKIEIDPDKPQLIKTVRGVGYMYVPTTS
ncbi:MAG: response regulator [Pseudomonadota bacterium]|nr:MAG: response regulator [Pseudomonadota bacterium]